MPHCLRQFQFVSIILAQFFKISIHALANMAQWIECQPVNQRVAGSIPDWGTCLATC